MLVLGMPKKLARGSMKLRNPPDTKYTVVPHRCNRVISSLKIRLIIEKIRLIIELELNLIVGGLTHWMPGVRMSAGFFELLNCVICFLEGWMMSSRAFKASWKVTDPPMAFLVLKGQKKAQTCNRFPK